MKGLGTYFIIYLSEVYDKTDSGNTDTVDYEILSAKMWVYGIRGLAYNLFKSYFTNRCSYIIVWDRAGNVHKQYYSEPVNIRCGVPQGSVLGPTLYINIFVNDLYLHLALVYCLLPQYVLNTSCVIFGSMVGQISERATCTVSALHAWCDSNKLFLNRENTGLIHFCAGQTVNCSPYTT